MSCSDCGLAEVAVMNGERGVAYVRVGNEKIGYGGVGLIGCEAHLKIIMEKLRG